MVVIFLPATSLIEVWQDRTASLLTWTVQAPQRPAPQTNFVPVICNCSRMAQSSGVSPAASTDLLCPLIFRVAICFFPCRCMKPFTTASHVAGGWSPTGSAPVGAQHDRLAVERQSKLKSVEENNFPN